MWTWRSRRFSEVEVKRRILVLLKANAAIFVHSDKRSILSFAVKIFNFAISHEFLLRLPASRVFQLGLATSNHWAVRSGGSTGFIRRVGLDDVSSEEVVVEVVRVAIEHFYAHMWAEWWTERDSEWSTGCCLPLLAEQTIQDVQKSKFGMRVCRLECSCFSLCWYGFCGQMVLVCCFLFLAISVMPSRFFHGLSRFLAFLCNCVQLGESVREICRCCETWTAWQLRIFHSNFNINVFVIWYFL